MKRLIILLFILHPSSFTLHRLWAQPHVDEAFRTLALAANPEGKLNTERFETTTDSRWTEVTKVTFSLSPAQRALLDMVYEAMEADRAVCTQYRRQDAYSAHNRPIDIVTPHHELHSKVDDHVNVLWGGFFDTSTSTTLYRYYVLAWHIEHDGRIDGTMYRMTFDADTQEPQIQVPSTPRYQPLLTAIERFRGDSTLLVSRSLSWRRASATGQWTHIHNVWGFNMPLKDESRLLGPLWKAFIDAEPRSYRFLNKPAGVAASDVQIVCDEYGHTVGFGLQSDWNIVYVYFTDEDFPKNRYVYALWYKADVPRQRIVGELIEINTERPDGGNVVQPNVQMTVPTYLWRMASPLLTSPGGGTDGDEVYPSPLGGIVGGAVPPDYQRLRRILSDKANEGRDDDDTEYQRSFGSRMQERGMSLGNLRYELDKLMHEYADRRAQYEAAVMNCSDNFRTVIKEITNPANRISNVQFNSLPLRERREIIDQLRQEIDSILRFINGIHRANLDSIARNYDFSFYHVFTKDSIPMPLFTSAFDGFARAYRGDGSQTDATIAERLRQMAEMMAEEGSRIERRKMVGRLDSLRALAPSDLARGSFDEAIVTLGGHIVTKTRREYDKHGRVSVERKWSYATMDNEHNTETPGIVRYNAKVVSKEDIDLGERRVAQEHQVVRSKLVNNFGRYIRAIGLEALEGDGPKLSRGTQRSVRRMERRIKSQVRRLERRIK